MEFAQVWENIQFLYGKLSAREGKYIRNYNRYLSNGNRRIDLWSQYVPPITYNSGAIGTDGVQTQINVIRSAVDTIVSKMSQAKVRPFFNPFDGDFETRKACKEIQQFFDQFFDMAGIYKKNPHVLRDALVFDVGVWWVDEKKSKVCKVNPWEYFIDPAEFYFGQVTRAMIFRKNVPIISLKDYITDEKLKKQLEKDPRSKGEYVIYYDLIDGKRHDFFDGQPICDPTDTNFEVYDGLQQRPFVELFYDDPMKSFFSVSLADVIYPIQCQVDELTERIDAATRNGLTNTVFIPGGSDNVKASMLTNGAGNIVGYLPGPDGGQPTVSTPPAIHGQYHDLLQYYIQLAYDMAGISQLSAQSKKPAGLDAGVALQTFEDIESERHNTLLQKYIASFIDLAKVIIDCFPKDADIMPKSRGRAKVKFADVKKQRKNFSLQFSAGSALSKDPATKLQQIEKLLEMGFIDQESASQFLDLPDLEGVYSHITAGADYCDKIIERAIRDGVTDYVETVPLKMLLKKTATMINHLEAVDEDEKIIDNLKDLLVKVKSDIDMSDEAGMPPQPEALPPMAPPGPPPVNPGIPNMAGGPI
jgi:hypothetical protein